MSIEFAGQQLPLTSDLEPVTDANVRRWLSDFLTLDDLRILGVESIARYKQRGSDLLSYPNYAERPALRINQLYWPVGASRWAVGLFLADAAKLSAIRSNLTNGRGQFKWFGAHAADLYMLTPRRISSDVANPLWLLPLVDERYWWQYVSTEDITVEDGTTTWSDLLDAVKDKLGITLTNTTPDSAYGTPDPDAINQHQYHNAAVLLDAIAYTLGRRVVDDFGRTTVESVTWTGSNTPDIMRPLGQAAYRLQEWSDASDQLSQIVAGGEVVPDFVVESVEVAFPWRNLECGADPEWYTIIKAAEDYTSQNSIPNTIKTVRSTAVAERGSTATSTPDNESDLDALADQIASDYYAGQAKTVDACLAGYFTWIPTSFHDHAEYRFDEGTIRLHGVPYNQDTEQHFQQVVSPKPRPVACWFEFSILSVDDETSPIEAQVDPTWWEPGTDAPPSPVTVKDSSGCILDEDPEDMVGRWGTAFATTNDSGDVEYHSWNLCCPPGVV